jgi:hypothetical protein
MKQSPQASAEPDVTIDEFEEKMKAEPFGPALVQTNRSDQ